MVGGLLEYADAKNIVIVRKENGQDRHFKFNYKDVVRQKNVEQNIAPQAGRHDHRPVTGNVVCALTVGCVVAAGPCFAQSTGSGRLYRGIFGGQGNPAHKLDLTAHPVGGL